MMVNYLMKNLVIVWGIGWIQVWIILHILKAQIQMVIIGMTADWMEYVLVIQMIQMEMKMEQSKTINGIEVRVMRRIISMTMMIYLEV